MKQYSTPWIISSVAIAAMLTVGAIFTIMTTSSGGSAPSESTGPRTVFSNVSAQAGLSASHRGSWNEYSQTEPFDDGYLAVGQAWGDYNNDGWLDLYVTGNMDNNVLYRNNRDGTLSISTLSEAVSLPGVLSGGAVWADYDNDGWRDLYVLNYGRNVLFRNIGGRGFEDVTDIAGVGDRGKGTTAAWGDYDEDGFLDLYVVNWSCYPKCDPLDVEQSQDRLYRNNGDGSFSDVTVTLNYEKTLGSGFSAAFADYDNDGDPDLYVINDQLKNPIGNLLWRNDGPGCSGWCWTDVSVEAGADNQVHGMGLAVGDYDNDLDLDFYFTNMVHPMALLQNQGNGTFVDQALSSRVAVGPSDTVGWGTAFFDYDNDGWLDIYLTTTEFRLYDGGMNFSYPDFLFRNHGDGTFSNESRMTLPDNRQPSMGLAYADYDNDGWIDYVLGNWNEGYLLYRNQGGDSSDNHWLAVRLSGNGPVNRDAIGARVYLLSDDGRTQMREVKSGSSLGAGHDTALHFGLGQAGVERLTVLWPDGLTETFEGVAVDQVWQLTYGQAQVVSRRPQSSSVLEIVVLAITNSLLALLLWFLLRRKG